MKTIIAGGRNIFDYEWVRLAADLSEWPITEVVSGYADGVDRFGERWAGEHGIPVKRFIPDWDRFGKGAGFIRNEEMSVYGEALIAVWDGMTRGTAHMIRTMLKKTTFVSVLYVTGM